MSILDQEFVLPDGRTTTMRIASEEDVLMMSAALSKRAADLQAEAAFFQAAGAARIAEA